MVERKAELKRRYHRKKKIPKLKVKLAAAKTTLFQGESLRSMLLSAWGWSQVALYAFYASIGLMLATAVVAAAMIFELVTAFRRQPLIVSKPVTA